MAKKLSKRQQAKLSYMDEHAELAMQSICKSFKADKPNHLVTTAYRWGFEDVYKWYMNHPIGVLVDEYAMAIYSFINAWKMGQYGEVSLQKAIIENFRY